MFGVPERRPLKGFMKMYKTPPQRRRKKEEMDEVEAVEVDAELSMAQALDPRAVQVVTTREPVSHLIANNVGGTLGRAHKGVTASPSASSMSGVGDPMLMDSLHALELANAARMQESCI
ncbi:hypothetical protein B566_EDAN003736 [Ephemera danica]|nr:hypothetical protein B566_EDAN003736 [Ephemera danica]